MTRLTRTSFFTVMAAVVLCGLQMPLRAAGPDVNRRPARPAPAAPSRPPQIVSIEADTFQVRVDWAPVEGAVAYHVFRAKNGAWGTRPIAEVQRTAFRDHVVASGVTYAYKVAAINRGGAGPLSTPASVTPLAPPAGLTAAAGDRQVTLAWQTARGAASYAVLRRIAGSNRPFEVVANRVAQPVYVDTGLTNGRTYAYRVRSLGPNATSAPSRPVRATPRPAPTPAPTASPVNLQATAGNASVVLTWGAVPGATSYAVFRTTSTTFPTTPLVTVAGTTFTDTSVTNGTAYSYRVTARNGGGDGPPSVPASATPAAPVVAPTAAPGNLTATPGNGSVGLTWTAVPTATSHAIFRTTTGTFPTTPLTTVEGTSFTDTGLTNGTAYSYRVVGRNTAGDGPPASASATPVAPVVAPTAAPGNLTATPGNGSVGLTWTAVPAATSYAIFRSTTGTFPATPLATVTVTSFGDTGLVNGTPYSYRVVGRNAGGDGPGSIAMATPAAPAAPLAAPTGISVLPSGAALAVSWTVVPGATGYNVYRGVAANGQMPVPFGTVTAPPFIDPNVVPGQTYFYRVTATGAGPESPRSAEASGSVPTVPINPTTISAVRFLRQATWGPRPGDVDRLVSGGVDGFLAEQFAATPSVYPDALIDGGAFEPVQEHFMQLAMSGQDQLRQRVAWALHKIWVVSGVEVTNVGGIVTYYRLMMNGAFGNYRDLMENVTLNPAMGRYLNMVNNRAQANTGVPANENYARELMQLFTLGLVQLNPDGTPVLDGSGQPVPSYTEEDVKALARILTGWTYGDGNAATIPTGGGSTNFRVPMEAVAPNANPAQNRHDVTAKTFLGVDFPAGRTAQVELDAALDVLFEHQNIGPFVAKQLIQQLVTSNPSPAYVQAVADVFNGAGGTRGDLAAVVRAILTHPEAAATTATSGKLAEPVLFVTSQLRAINATVTDHPFMSTRVAEMGQNVFFPPSVFSYFSPSFRVRNTGTPALVGPEFQGLTSVTALLRANFVGSLLGGSFGSAVTIDYAPFTSRAATPADLVDYVSLVFTGGRMPSAQRTEVIAAVTATAASNPTERVRTAIYLTLVPATFQVDR